MLDTVFGPGQVAYSILWFFLFFIEIWLMISVFIDIFRSDDLRGWAKALWVILVLVLPLVGILAYLVARGDKMRAHRIQTLQQQEEAFRRYVLSVVGPRSSPTEELERLADLRDRGELTAAEYRMLKARIIGDEDVAAA